MLNKCSVSRPTERVITLLKWFATVTISCILFTGTAISATLNDAYASYSRGDYVHAIKLFRPLAGGGSAIAQYNLGSMYAQGDGVKQDYQAAFYWYRLAAMSGHEAAQFSLGCMYASGQGVIQDHQEAVHWYRLASAQGSPGAQFNLGWMYDHGQGVKRDYQEAVNWYRLSATQGLAVAQTQLGVRYAGGWGVAKDYQAALKWFRLSVAQRDPGGQFHLGWMYDSGQGVIQDYEEAVHWYHLSAAQGYGPAMTVLERPNMILAAKKIAAMQVRPQRPQRVIHSVRNEARNTDPVSVPLLTFELSPLRDDGSIELIGRVTSSVGISQVLINGRDLEMPLSKDGSFKVTRVPPVGMTTYRLSVLDEFGQRGDAEVSTERKMTQMMDEIALLNPRKMMAKPNPSAVALIVGIESYANLPQAQYADSDASLFYDYAHHALGVPIKRIKLLTNAQAGRTDLLKAIRAWMKSEIVDGRSNVYIFFAGHGLSSVDGSKSYLLPADGDPSLLDETSILRDDLIASAKGAQTVTLFMDTCYSGATRGKGVLLTGARPIGIVPDENGLPPNVTLLAAATGAQLSSSYDDAQQGLFSYWLMKGLEGDAESNGDRKITVGELHNYISKRVKQIAARRNRQQDPQLIGDSTRVLVNY